MKVFLLSLFIYSSTLFAVEIEIVGNTKTHPDVIKSEISDLLLQEKLSKEDVTEIKRRLWNLRIFSNVDTDIENKILVITVEERWTTIPIAQFSGGGGSSYYAIGFYDINTAGLNTELGLQYESLNNRPAGVVWLRKPQFLNDRNLRFGIDLWSINRIRYLYTRESEDNGGFTLRRKRYSSFIEKRWDNDLYTLGFNYNYLIDEVSELDLEDELIDQNNANSFTPSENEINRWHTLYLNIGRIDKINYLSYGKRLSLTSSLISVSSGEDEILSSHTLTYQYYKLFKNHVNLAWQFRARGNNLRSIHTQNFVGGLSEVRGYLDGQFFDRANWRNNLEYRFDVYENKFGVIQAVVFSDQAKEGKDIEDILDSNDEILLSSGLGLRFISPKIYNFVGRLDYAQTHTRVIERGIAFGAQQFF